MFQPEISLVPQGDGTFTLVVKALVPNSCYVAGPLKPGPPPGSVVIPEVLPFTFEIIHRGGICAQYVHYVSTSVSGLRPDAGHRSAIVFAVVDGHVTGHAAVSFPPADQVRALAGGGPPHGSIIPESVSATVFSGLVGPAEFRVVCLVATPTPGYKAALAPAKPQGINPSILLMTLTLTPPSGPVIQIPSTALALYEVKPYSGKYTDVTILNGPQSVTVPVIVIFSAFDPTKKYQFSTFVGNG